MVWNWWPCERGHETRAVTSHIFSKGRYSATEGTLQGWTSQSTVSSVYPTLRRAGEYVAFDGNGLSWGLLLNIIS